MLVTIWNTNFYNSHFNAYDVSETSEHKLISTDDIKINDIYAVNSQAERNYITIRSFHHVEFDL